MKIIFILFAVISSGFCSAQSADSFYKRSVSLRENKQYDKALEQIDKALKLDSLNSNYLSEKSTSLVGLKMFQEAFDALSKAISIDPKKSFLYNQRGNLLLSIQQFDYSVLDFTAAMNVAESDSIRNFLIVNRASAKIYKRDFGGAYEDLMTAYRYDSTDIATLTNLASICDEVGKGDETLKYLLRAIEKKPDFYPAYGNIGFKYQEMGNYKKAIEYFNKVLEFEPNEPLGYSNRSFNKYKLGDLKGAHEDIEKSIQLYPTNSYAYRIRALISIAENKIENACRDLNKAIELGFTTTYGDEALNLKKKYCKD